MNHEQCDKEISLSNIEKRGRRRYLEELKKKNLLVLKI